MFTVIRLAKQISAAPIFKILKKNIAAWINNTLLFALNSQKTHSVV